jgi:hypothetical protein
MEEREEHIERLKQSIADAKPLQQNIADTEKILRKSTPRPPEKPKSK